MTNEEILASLPPIPEGATFHLEKVETVSVPHPYCITPKHIAVAADQFGGILGKEAIAKTERQGGGCGVKLFAGGYCQLPYDQHKSLLALFIRTPRKLHRLDECLDLQAYLVKIKEKFAHLGILGFLFPYDKE